jgi:5-methylcytosine-specific restriction endonuclease McrA
MGMQFGVLIVNEDIHHKIQAVSKEHGGFSGDKEHALAFKWAWRRLHRPLSTATDGLTRETARMYVGLEHEAGEGDFQYNKGSFRQVQIPRYFRARLEKWNKERQEKDRAEVTLREQIAEVRDRVYSSRRFPSVLRTIIFARDNYTCQACLRPRAELLRAGLHLECDHIVAWEDDGQTTYKNGQTICSDCNKAKHHAKAYLGMVSRLGVTNVR